MIFQLKINLDILLNKIFTNQLYLLKQILKKRKIFQI